MEAKFDFNVEPFVAGIQKMGSKFGEAVKGMALKVGALAAGIMSVRSLLNNMPEIGKAFGIAKDIFMKNFAWPLRLQIMPLLQKMLDWVRDHRAKFVQWGMIMTNILRSVWQGVKILLEPIKALVMLIGGTLMKSLGIGAKSIDDFMNILSFKIAAVIIYLGLLIKSAEKTLEPFVKNVVEIVGGAINGIIRLFEMWGKANENGDSLGTVFKQLAISLEKIFGALKSITTGLIDGLVDSLQGAMTPLTHITESFNELLKALGIDESKGLYGAFKLIGKYVGTTFMAILSIVALQVKFIVAEVTSAIKGIQALIALGQGKPDVAKALAEEISQTWKDVFAEGKTTMAGIVKGYGSVIEGIDLGAIGKALGIGQPDVKVKDAIITKGGQVIQTSPDDNIIATKFGLGRGGGAGVTVNAPVTVYVTEGNAEAAGANFARGLGNTLRASIQGTRLAEGY